MRQIERDSADNGGEELLKAISAAGGFGIEEEAGTDQYENDRIVGGRGMFGELEQFLENLNRSTGRIRRGARAGESMSRQMRGSGGLPGIPSIVRRKGGYTADRIREAISQDPRWEGKYDNLSEFLADVDDAIAVAVGMREAPGASVVDVASVLDGLFGVRADAVWWETPTVAEPTLEGEGDAAAGEAGQSGRTMFQSEAWLEILDDAGDNNASGESSASLEAISRQRAMKARRQQFVVYDRTGGRRVIIGPDAVDYVARAGEAFGIEGPEGFTLLDQNGGKIPENTAANRARRELSQGLFDEEEKVDRLITGEQQPRLPGEVGDVRDQEVAQPKIGDAGDTFDLTPPAETEHKQTTLFQPAYHGSPHTFERFSLHAIGSGEGSQAYGWGLYFTSTREIAEWYRDKLSPEVGVSLDGGETRGVSALLHDPSVSADERYVLNAIINDNEAVSGRVKAALSARANWYEMLSGYEDRAEWAQQMKAAALSLASRVEDGKTGRLYKVEIPDGDEMLDWDKPASEQTPSVQAKLKELGISWTPEVVPSFAEALGLINSIATYERARLSWNKVGTTDQEHILEAARLIKAEDRPGFERWWHHHSAVLTGKRSEDPTGAVLYEELLRNLQNEQYKRTGKVEREARGQAARQASEALNRVGIHGIKYLDGSSRRNGEGSSNFVIFDDRLVQITEFDQRETLDQELGQDEDTKQPGRRGYINFGPERKFNIGLLEKADLSTFIHESGHFFLEVFGDVIEAMGEGELNEKQQRLVTDYKTLLAWFGVERRDQITDEHHELFARGFEAYLMEGKAPSIELREAFSRYRAWLLGIYRSIKALKAPLTPEVRDVFDRMLATDQAILEAEQEGRVLPMFTTAQTAGMSETRFAAYREKIAQASRSAREWLETRLLNEKQRELTAEWKRRKAEIRAVVEQDAHAMPVYQAWSAIQHGTTPAGEPLLEGEDPKPAKLSKRSLEIYVGRNRFKTLGLPKTLYTTSDAGLDPAPMAEMFGFSSVASMVDALAKATPMKVYIEKETTRRMLAENGGMLLDGTFHEKARQAISNEDRDLIIREEIRALAELQQIAKPFETAVRKEERAKSEVERRWLEAEGKLKLAIQKAESDEEIEALRQEVISLRRKARGGAAKIRAALPSDESIRQLAAEEVARTRVRRLKPEIFWAASRKAAQQAIEAAARQDLEAAIVFKQQELVNLALYRETMKARDEVEARVKRAKELSKGEARQRLGKAGHDYLDQVDGILDRYSFAKASQKALDRRQSIAAWIAAREAEGLPVDLPAYVLEEQRRTPYQELTVEELIGVTDALDSIVHLAQVKNRLLKAADQREFDTIIEELETSIRENRAKREASETARRDRRPATERARTIGSMFASHRKISELARRIDGWKDGGPFWRLVIKVLNDAGDKEAVMIGDATKALSALVEAAFPGTKKGALYVDEDVPEVGRAMSKMERIMVALNWGNEGNRQRVRAYEKWDDRQVAAVLDGLTLEEWQFVQGVWDLINSYWPEIAEKQERVFGVAPEKVIASEVSTKFGVFTGGYFPLKYDERLSQTAAAHLDLEAGLAAKQAAYVKATTRRSHTEARAAKVSEPVRYDFGVIDEHLIQVIHDLSHHEALLDVGRILSDKRIQKAIVETHGDIIYKQFKDALRDIAFGQVPAANGFEKSMNHIRSGATIAGLGWKFTTGALQLLGITQSIHRIGAKWVGRGVSRWLRNPSSMVATVDWIYSVSPMMRLRGQTQMREINEIRQQIGISAGKVSGWVDGAIRGVSFNQVTKAGIADTFFWTITTMQKLVDVPTWLGAYEKHMSAGLSEEMAIALADQAVLDSQGGGQVKDLAAVQRGSPLLKMWTTFYSFFNTTLQRLIESHERTNYKNPAQVGRLAADYLVLIVIPATLGMLIKDAMKGGDGDDADDLGEKIVRENVAYLMGTMLGVRELSGFAQGYSGYEGPAGARAFSALGKFAKQAEQGEFDAAFWRALNDSAGILLHYPAGQVRLTVEGIAALAEGKTDNPAAVVGGVKR